MGSYTNAPMTGFICRVCSEHKQSLIHFFGVKAADMMLMEKLRLLPIMVTKHDNLPKTLCEDCMEKLTAQYDLVQKIRRSIALQNRHTRYHRNGNCPRACPLFGIRNSALQDQAAASSRESEEVAPPEELDSDLTNNSDTQSNAYSVET